MDFKVILMILLLVIGGNLGEETGKRDYYEILGVGRSATTTQIKKAFHNLARIYHPDKNKEDGADRIFREIAEAYEVLSDQKKRQEYDQYGHQANNNAPAHQHHGHFNEFGELFEDFFGGDHFGRARQPSGGEGKTCRTTTVRTGNTIYTYTECH